MQSLRRRAPVLAFGVSLLALPGLLFAQTISPQTPVVTQVPVVAQAPTMVVQVAPPFCDDLHTTVPSGNGVVNTTCLLPVDATTGLLCLVSVAAGGGLASSCSNVFMTTPGTIPPVQLPASNPPAAAK